MSLLDAVAADAAPNGDSVGTERPGGDSPARAFRAAATAAEFPLVTVGAPHSCCRSTLVRFSLPGNPSQSVHLTCPAITSAALTASHSFGETTATRLPLRTSA